MHVQLESLAQDFYIYQYSRNHHFSDKARDIHCLMNFRVSWETRNADF